jgi:hypothetical protein
LIKSIGYFNKVNLKIKDLKVNGGRGGGVGFFSWVEEWGWGGASIYTAINKPSQK